MTFPRSILSSLVAVSFTACGADSTGPGGGGGGGREIVPDPSFATHINEILSRNGCTGGACHGSGGDGAVQTGLVLQAGSAANYGQLVNATASQDANLFRVDPGSPATSYLMIKLAANPPVGLRMPRNGTPLDNIDMSNLTNWINDGAPNN